MKKYNQLKSFKEAIGKKIDRINELNGELFFFFTDDTFFIITEHGYDGDIDIGIHELSFSLNPTHFNFLNLHSLGIITPDERDAISNNRKELYDLENEKRDKNEYERLKNKYETTII